MFAPVNDEPTIFHLSATWGLEVPVNGVEPVNILIPDDPAWKPSSVRVIVLNVELSLVAETVKSEVPSGSSAKTTILALLGVVWAVKVSYTKVILLALAPASKTKSIPPAPPWWPPSPPGPPPALCTITFSAK